MSYADGATAAAVASGMLRDLHSNATQLLNGNATDKRMDCQFFVVVV